MNYVAAFILRLLAQAAYRSRFTVVATALPTYRGVPCARACAIEFESAAEEAEES